MTALPSDRNVRSLGRAANPVARTRWRRARWRDDRRRHELASPAGAARRRLAQYRDHRRSRRERQRARHGVPRGRWHPGGSLEGTASQRPAGATDPRPLPACHRARAQGRDPGRGGVPACGRRRGVRPAARGRGEPALGHALRRQAGGGAEHLSQPPRTRPGQSATCRHDRGPQQPAPAGPERPDVPLQHGQDRLWQASRRAGWR